MGKWNGDRSMGLWESGGGRERERERERERVYLQLLPSSDQQPSPMECH